MYKRQGPANETDDYGSYGPYRQSLRGEIYRAFAKHLVEQDKAYLLSLIHILYGRENVEAMYIQYHNLGGNGTITELKRKLDQLPTEEEEA